MPWSSGLFSRLYNFVNDSQATPPVKILALKQDQEWDNVVTGLNLVLCRDGQNSPTTDINWAGHKITNLANGTAATDAATVGQLPQANNEYVLETNTIGYVSPTVFRVAGSDQTFRYHAGRRVMFVWGGNYRMGTVLSSAYIAPDTMVTITPDNSPMDPAIFQIWYGLLTYSYPGPSYTSPRSYLYVQNAVEQQFPGAGVIPFGAPGLDALAEWNATSHVFTAHYTGIYRVWGAVSIKITTSTTNMGFNVYLVANSVAQASSAFGSIPGTSVPGMYISLPFSSLISLAAGGNFYVATSVGPAPWTVSTGGTFLCVDRIL